MASDSGSGVGPEATVAVPLAEGFDHDLAEWEKATAAVLRKTKKLGDDDPDTDVWRLLSTTTLDGIEVAPLGTPDIVAGLPGTGLPGQAPYTRGAEATRELDGWDVRAYFADPDVDRTAEHVVTDLENGVNSLWLAVGDDAVPADALAGVLEPVFLDLAPVVLDAPADPLGAARALAAVLEDRAVDAAPGTNLGVDPLAARLRGRGETDLAVVAQAAEIAVTRGVRAVVVDGTAVHDAGGSDVQELAHVLLTGATYLRLLTGTGRSAEDAAAQLDVRLAATDEQFPTIAKLRAARRLWDRLLELSGVAPQHRGQRQHAVTSRSMMAAYDPYANMLRTTIAAFAAGVGGASSVTVLPFDDPLGLPEPFSRRIARNTSSLLVSESHVARVLDPAGGSHTVEKLTDDLARAAWELFGELDAAREQAGDDVDAALDLLRSRVEATVSERALAVARRTRPITGVSEFPNLHEERPERRPHGRELPVLRYGHEFEAMRDERAADPVFLATIGTIAQHTARATFVANLFAAGGIDTVTAGATANADEVVAAYRDAGTPAVACLAGPDALYAEWGADVVTALREAGARRVVVAGRAESVEADVDDAAAMGLDALAFLRRTREELTA